MNFPNMHPLYARGAGPVTQADVILGLELTDFFGTVNEFIDSAERSRARACVRTPSSSASTASTST